MRTRRRLLFIATPTECVIDLDLHIEKIFFSCLRPLLSELHLFEASKEVAKIVLSDTNYNNQVQILETLCTTSCTHFLPFITFSSIINSLLGKMFTIRKFDVSLRVTRANKVV
jgi:hypothetical protein